MQDTHYVKKQSRREFLLGTCSLLIFYFFPMLMPRKEKKPLGGGLVQYDGWILKKADLLEGGIS